MTSYTELTGITRPKDLARLAMLEEVGDAAGAAQYASNVLKARDKMIEFATAPSRNRFLDQFKTIKRRVR